MLCKSLGKHRSYGDDSNQCIIYRKCKPKTFSGFVDNIIRELPETVSSRRCPMDTNNPIDVLKSKGLLNCYQNPMLHRDCSSDVTLNFYSEELRCGEPVKIFASNHHFKHGKLVYYSTHEILPDHSTEIDRSINLMTRRQRALSEVNLCTSSRDVRKRSVKKNLSDILGDVERQKIIHHYNSDGRRRQFCSRSLSPVNLCDMENKKTERYLHTLRSKHMKQPLSPRPYGCHVTKYTPFAYSDSPVCKKSSSEISISSRRSWIFSSPKKTIEETSRFDKQYRCTRISPPRPKIKRDFFVIPDHTCRKVPHVERYRSHWNTVSRFVTSPCEMYNKDQDDVSNNFRKEEIGQSDHIIRDSNMQHKYRNRINKSVDHDRKIRRGEDNITSLKSGRKTAQSRSPLKGILTTKDERTSRISPPRHRIRFHNDTIYSNEKMHREKPKTDYSGRNHIKLVSHHEHGKTETSEDEKSDTFEQDKREESFRCTGRKLRDVATSTESETESDSSTSTEPFSTSRDLVDQRGTTGQFSSDASETSVCSIRHNDQLNTIDSSQKNVKKSTNQQLRKKYHKKHKEQRYEHSETSTKRGTRNHKPAKIGHDIIQEESKHSKKRRQINPNKIVHIEDDGKRFSQYYSDGKVTLDSEKAFEEEEKIRSKKIQFHSCSPKRNNTTKSWKVYSEESLEDYLKRVLIEDHQKNLRLIENVINKEALTEYKRKYANYSTNSSKKKLLRSSEREHCHEYEITNNRRCNSDDCDACIIERLLGEG